MIKEEENSEDEFDIDEVDEYKESEERKHDFDIDDIYECSDKVKIPVKQLETKKDYVQIQVIKNISKASPSQVIKKETFRDICPLCGIKTIKNIQGHMIACQQNILTSEKKARINCPICGKSYEKVYFVDVHYFKCSNWTINGSKEKRALYEEKKQQRKEEARKKRKAAREEGVPVTCSECGKVYHDEIALRAHIRNIHNPNQSTFFCDKCDFNTYNKTTLRTHVNNRHTEAVFITCDICGAKLKNTPINIRQHHRNKHGNHEMVKCEECGKELRKIAYKKHLEQVHGERKHACQLCSYRAQTGYNLKLHISKSHLGVKDLPKEKCQYCELETTNLPLHMKNHHPQI